MTRLDYVTIRGFKSFANLEKFEVKPLNVLIGANGSGKSNFIEFFGMLREMLEGRLAPFVAREGGADVLLHFGGKQTPEMQFELVFDDDTYSATLTRTKENSLMVSVQVAGGSKGVRVRHIPSARPPALGDIARDKPIVPAELKVFVVPATQWRVYHFGDTSFNSPMKLTQHAEDNEYFRGDGANLGPFLLRLRERFRGSYDNIVSTIQLVAPFFGDFDLRSNEDPVRPTMRLKWKHRDSDAFFDVSQLSDGTLRFMALATLLQQPDALMPSLLLIDEPEIGLHPYAIHVLAGLLQSASSHTQVIVATQSVTLVNQLQLDELVIAERKNNESTLRRVKEKEIRSWLEDYSLGELWEKNVLGGRP